MDPSDPTDYAILVNAAGLVILAAGLIAGLILFIRLLRTGRRAERPLPVDVIVAARTPPAPSPPAAPPGQPGGGKSS